MKGSVERLERVEDLEGATMEGLDMSRRRSQALHHSMGEKFLNYDTLAMEGMMGEEREEELKQDLCVQRGRRPFYIHWGVEERLETKRNSHLNPQKGSSSNKCLEYIDISTPVEFDLGTPSTTLKCLSVGDFLFLCKRFLVQVLWLYIDIPTLVRFNIETSQC